MPGGISTATATVSPIEILAFCCIGTVLICSSHEFAQSVSFGSCMKRVLLIPFPGLCYFSLLKSSLESRGLSVSTAWRFPKRGIFLGPRLDVIHIHMVDLLFLQHSLFDAFLRSAYFFLVIAPVSFVRRIKLVWTCHEWYPHDIFGIRRAVVVLISFCLLTVASKVVVHSQANLDFLRGLFFGLFRGKIVFVSHGTLLPYYTRSVGFIGCRKESHFPVPSDCRYAAIFGVFGHMRPNKGTDLILKAFRELPDHDICLYVVGNCNDDSYFALLAGLARVDSRVVIQRGNISDKDLVGMHLSSDAILFGFRNCPTTGSLVTALSLGSFVIAPSLGHCLEIVGEADGLLYDQSSSPRSLTSALSLFLQRKRNEASSLNQRTPRWADLPENQWPYILDQYFCIYGFR